MFQAVRQATREDHPFDRALFEGFRLADKGIDERERTQMRAARVRLLLYPELDPAERVRFEEELEALEAKALAGLSKEDRARLSAASDTERSDKTYVDLERSLKSHVESAELRLNRSAREKLLRARRSGPTTEERGKLEGEKSALEQKAWGTLREQERAALEFFEDALPVTPDEREQLRAERSGLEQRAVGTLPADARARIEAIELQRRAEASLSDAEREQLHASPERQEQEQELAQLRAKAEEGLGLEDRTTLLRSRLLERRDEAEEALSANERRALEQARLRLRALKEREDLERSAEERLSSESRARLDELRETLELRKDQRILRERAEAGLSLEDQERLRRLRSQLRITPGERRRLAQRFQQLAFGNLSPEPGSFGPGLSERDALTRSQAYLEEILRVAPFNGMLDRFALEGDEQGAERLCDLILRETRDRQFTRDGERREVIVRQGDYGGTAFLILEGRVRILIQSDEEAAATAAALGSVESRRKGFLGLLARWLGASRGREVRREIDERYSGVRPGDDPVPLVIPKFSKIAAQSAEHTLGEGEVFGEIAALTRTPRTATVVPDTAAVRLLEIRWQGLRDLVTDDEAFQKYVEERYRDSSRRAYVFRTGLFAGVGDTPGVREAIRDADVERLFRVELGWGGPREREGWPLEFQVLASPPAPLACQLRVWRGANEQVVPLAADANVVQIGAGASNHLKIERRPAVSEEHAELRLRQGRWYLRNLSRHGTLLDGERVRTQVVLFGGAEVRIGDACRIRFEVAPEGTISAGGIPVALVAESAVVNGIGGIKAYRCALGDRPLPDEATCAAIAEQVRRREYLRGEESRSVLVFRGADARQQDWRWSLPTHDGQIPDERERSGLRYKGDADPLIERVLHFLALEEVVKATEFLSFGKFRWFERSPEEELDGTHWTTRVENQPVIATQGHYPNGVYMVRAGFARLTQETDQGERTVSYLRPEAPYGYGLEPVIENFLAKREEERDPSQVVPRVLLPHTLRAVGYADTVFFPTSVLERFVLPSYPLEDLRALVAGERQPKGLHGLETVPDEVPADLRDFLVDNHLINGRQAMAINLDRCTRCDDCVRGCASSHQENPRFIRHGPTHGNLMVTNACMHCVDPVCLIDCPTGAIHRPLGGGLVVIHDSTCIGCGACAHNCPYDNIRMVPIRNGEEGVVATREADGGAGAPQLRATKCDLCYDQATKETACVRACPHDALRRVDLSDLNALGELQKWLQ